MPTRVTPSMSLSEASRLGGALLALGAALDHQRGADDRRVGRGRGGRVAAAHRGAGRRGAGEVLERDLLRDHQRELVEDALPVEAALGEAADGLGAGCLEVGEARVGASCDAVGRPGPCAPRSVASSAFSSLMSLFGEHDEHDADQREREHADDRVGGDPGAQRRMVAAAVLGRDQVDGAHRLLLQPEPVGEGQSPRGAGRRPSAARRARRPRSGTGMSCSSRSTRPGIAVPGPATTTSSTRTASSNAA